MSERQTKKKRQAIIALVEASNLTSDELQIAIDQYRSQQSQIVLGGAPSLESTRAIQQYDIQGDIFAERILKPEREFMVAWDEIGASIAIIKQVAMCNNGPRTRDALKDAETSMMKHLENLWITVEKINGQTQRYDVYIDASALTPYLEPCAALRDRCVQFLTNETNTDAELDKLRNWIVATNPELKPLAQVLDDISGRRGKPRDRVRQYIGQLAAGFPDPPRGKGWQIGVDVYRTLLQGAKTKLQRDARDFLARYFYPDTSIVAEDQKRDLGVYIMKARRAAFYEN